MRSGSHATPRSWHSARGDLLQSLFDNGVQPGGRSGRICLGGTGALLRSRQRLPRLFRLETAAPCGSRTEPPEGKQV